MKQVVTIRSGRLLRILWTLETVAGAKNLLWQAITESCWNVLRAENLRQALKTFCSNNQRSWLIGSVQGSQVVVQIKELGKHRLHEAVSNQLISVHLGKAKLWVDWLNKAQLILQVDFEQEMVVRFIF